MVLRGLRRYGPDLAALLTVTVWGVSFTFQKAALEEMDPLAFAFVRYLGMIALGWGTLAWRHRAAGARIGIDRADLPRAALAGVLGYTLYILLSTVGLSYTTAFSTSLLIATAPLFSALLLWASRLEPIGGRQWGGMLLSLLGVLLFMAEKVHGGWGAAGLGDVMCMVGALFFAAYGVANKPLLARYSVATVMAYTLTIGAIPVLALSLPSTVAQDWTGISGAAWRALLWSIVVPVYVAWSVWSWSIARIGVARTSAFMYLVPVFGGAASWLHLGEGFGSLKIVGAALTLGGVILARWHAAPKLRPAGRLEHPVSTRLAA
jgi:drug/metabolite transporter (DMT)-like permease